MTTSTRIPPILQPYLQLPRQDAILLLTSTLGASANWLVIRFICDALKESHTLGEEVEGHNVVLVSWMREYEFWRQEARKGAGLDLERLKRESRFAFVDGLSGLCLDAASTQGSSLQTPRAGVGGAPITSSSRPSHVLPSRGTPVRTVPTRGPVIGSPAAQPHPALASPIMPTHPSITAPEAATAPAEGHYTLSTLDLAQLKTTVFNAVSALASASQRKTFIVLDNPDLFLALNPASTTPSSFASALLSLHKLPTVSHILTHIQADTPLLSLSLPPQPLELSHNNLLVKCAHMSRRIVGVRVLDTGVARDVSGVVRITEQKAGWLDLGVDGDERKGKGDESSKGKEFLYQVKGDGSVRVFERGAGGEV